MIATIAALALATPSLADGFRNVPNEARMRMYWRVFGPAWTPSEMDLELDQIKQAGVGGVTVYFMYPVALDDPAAGIKNLRFGSPEFLDSFRYASQAAKKRGLRFGVNGSTGWPFGGPSVSAQDSAQHLREVFVPKRTDLTKLDPRKNEHTVAVFRNGYFIDPNHLSGSGDTRAYIAGPTGMQVKRPAFGGEGLVLDHYDRGALDRYLKSVVEPMLKAADGTLENLGCDSLEVYGANWCDDLPDVFLKRHGYRLDLRLPDLFDPKSPAGMGVRFDFWRTLAELTEERFTKPLGEWCGRNHIDLEMEPYGTPPNPMTSSRYIQTPTGEHYEWKGFSVQKYVSSAAHQAGRNIVSSEAWTWSGLPNRLADSLSDLKLVSDMTFLGGSNDLTGVDFPYSPRSAGSPGWTPYYGPFMGPGNSQWPMFPALVDYVNRCQWMLRQGSPVRDVGVYLPVEDSFREGSPDQMLLDFEVRDRLVTGKATSEFGLQNALKHNSDLVHGLISNGFDYDGIDFWSIERAARVRGSTLEVGPAKYKALVLPNLATIDLPALRKIAAFAESGGIVIATRRLPIRNPGLDDSSREVGELVAELFGIRPVPGQARSVGKGVAEFVQEDADAAPAIAKLLSPDVRYASLPSTVGFQHRRMADRDIYFFVNVGPDRVKLDLTVSAPERHFEEWDALSGKIFDLPSNPRITLTLEPRGSTFVVGGGPATPGALPRPVPANRTADIPGPWSLEFVGPDAPPPIARVTLGSWTAVSKARFFSGIGRYRTTFNLDRTAKEVLLDLGDVREAARVTVNGHLCGTAIVSPFEVDITDAVHIGENRLEVEVANLPVNRFIGLPRPDLGPLRKVYGNRFPIPEEHDLMKGIPAPSGLIGPVRLRLGD